MQTVFIDSSMVELFCTKVAEWGAWRGSLLTGSWNQVYNKQRSFELIQVFYTFDDQSEVSLDWLDGMIK